MTKRAKFLVDNLDLPAATGVADARWEHFQLHMLRDDSPFRIECKSRQIAFSWTSAAEAVANALLDQQDSIFVSINLEEAKEKIRYARQIYEVLAQKVVGLPKIVRDSQLNVEFSNHARLTSWPGRPPRGRAKSNVYLDEFAHVLYDDAIYTAALPIISKGGKLRVGSSPLGASGRFWEIDTQALMPYPGYTRKRTPWWETFAFSANVPRAIKEAPHMTTADRVAAFGLPRIRLLFENMYEEDFQQEYEAMYVDETVAFISWDELKTVQDDKHTCLRVRMRKQFDGAALEAAIKEVLQKCPETSFVFGMDIGRTRNTTELFVLGLGKSQMRPLRLVVSMSDTDFTMQEEAIAMVLSMMNIKLGMIDKTGLGMQLAEAATKKYPGVVFGIMFTSKTKTILATNAKKAVQLKLCPLPLWRDLAYQIHSIKRRITPQKNVVFDTDENEKHHADMFWAWALGLSAAKLFALTGGGHSSVSLSTIE